jgi:hypothetical protein
VSVGRQIGFWIAAFVGFLLFLLRVQRYPAALHRRHDRSPICSIRSPTGMERLGLSRLIATLVILVDLRHHLRAGR